STGPSTCSSPRISFSTRRSALPRCRGRPIALHERRAARPAKEFAMVTLIDLRRLLHALCARLAFAPPLFPRLVLRVVFTHSGYGNWPRLGQVVKVFTDLGIPFPQLQAPFVASVELGGGALVLIGLATRLAAVPLIGTMVVALVTALSEKITGLNALFGLAEFLYIVLLVGLIVGGAGAVSLDRFIARALDRADAEDRAEDGAVARAPLAHLNRQTS